MKKFPESVKKLHTSYQIMEVCVYLSRLNEIARNDMNNFLKTNTELLNDNVCFLRDQVRHLFQLYEDLFAINISPHYKNYNNNDNKIAEIYSPDSFFAYFMELYNKNMQFKNYLLVVLLKYAVAKISGMGNPRYEYNVVNFYSML